MGEAGIWCFIVCFGSAPAAKLATLDSFCETYQQQVLTKDEVKLVLALPKALRARMQANDLIYLCRCKRVALKECSNG